MSRVIRMTLRLPHDLHSKLVVLAKQQHRTLQKQIIHILWEYVN